MRKSVSKSNLFSNNLMKAMLLPFLILFFVFTVLPVLASMVISFLIMML